MLREILLSLSGVPSSIWSDVKNAESTAGAYGECFHQYTSISEQEMLRALGEIADLHIKVKEATATISKSHPSLICRAVSNHIKTTQLRHFVKAVVDVETSILQEDAAYVGAYKIVPLSTILTQFEPWRRRLELLWRTAKSMQPRMIAGDGVECSGAQLMAFLRKEQHTGYTDVRHCSIDLLVAAQRAWLQNLTPWVMYGHLPTFGAADFLIKRDSTQGVLEFYIDYSAVPHFVTSDAAEHILAIGSALCQIKSRAWHGSTYTLSVNVCTTLMPISLDQMNLLTFPLQPNDLYHTVNVINNTISQTALSHILPLELVLDLLQILRQYVLFQDGEFASTFIRQADSCRNRHQTSSDAAHPVRKVGRLDDIAISEAEVSSVLRKTWSDLSATISDLEVEDLLREKAMLWLRMQPLSAYRVSTLLPTPAGIAIRLPADTPLQLFMSSLDTEKYSDIGAYLISLRRAETQLTKLWTMPAHRRCHPAPPGPPRSSTSQGQQLLGKGKPQEEDRRVRMRRHWACASQALLVLSELGNYLHGEVIQNSLEQLRSWLLSRPSDRPGSSKTMSRPTTSLSMNNVFHSNGMPNPLGQSTNSILGGSDPRTMARAHRTYLVALYRSLLLNNETYVSTLSELFAITDHFIALFQRLQTIWQELHLLGDEQIIGAFSKYVQDERDVMTEMTRTNTTLMGILQDLVLALRLAERDRDLAFPNDGVVNVGGPANDENDFIPWKGRSLDRLLLKLDSLVVAKTENRFEDALIGIEDN